MMFANKISSSTSCSIWLPETSPPSSSQGVLRHRFESCNTSIELTARYYLYISGSMRVVGGPFDILDDLMISVMCLDRKIATHFSGGAYAAWRGAEKMIAN